MTYDAAGHSRRLNIDVPNGEDDPKYECYLKLYKAATWGDWATAESIFHNDPEMLTAKIDSEEETVLHAAVSSSGDMFFVQKLVNLMVRLGKPLGPRSSTGSTPLHCAAKAGNTQIARLLVEADPSLVTLLDTENDSPVHMAAYYHHEETTKYLLKETLRHNSSLLVGASGLRFLLSLINDGFYDLAVQVLQVNPRLSVDLLEGSEKRTALLALAEQPQAFQLCNKVRDEKLRRKYVVKNLLKSLVDEASKSEQPADILGPASRKAAECGNLKFVKVVIKAYPQIVTYVDSEGRNIFHIAVINRQENIFSLIFRLGSWRHFTKGFDAYGCTMLHHAAAFHPTAKINQIPGAALQMQRELQWYKAVEDIVHPSYKLKMNDDGKTPERVFIESHQKLVKEAGEWMQNTANSCTIVAALVMTTTLAAAAFTGSGRFHDDLSFMIFFIADALALFCSATSLLMFLGIHTSHYSQKDFLKKLPIKLAIGEITLFFSIGWMLAAFTASIHVMLSQRVSWIAVPIGLLACLPLLLSVLQFPLLVQLVYSTFRPPIRKHSDKLLL